MRAEERAIKASSEEQVNVWMVQVNWGTDKSSGPPLKKNCFLPVLNHSGVPLKKIHLQKSGAKRQKKRKKWWLHGMMAKVVKRIWIGGQMEKTGQDATIETPEKPEGECV